MAVAGVVTRSTSRRSMVESTQEDSPRKRVDFPENLTPERTSSSTPPGHSSQPGKSILKKDSQISSLEYEPNPPSKEITTKTLHDIYSSAIDLKSIENFNELLKVALLELEKNDGEKHYVYAALHASLRAKNTTISSGSLTSCANTLIRHARRDLLASEPCSNPSDANAMISILKVVDYLFFTFVTANAIDNSLSNWFLLRGLDALEAPETSRSVIGIYLHIFNYQKLPQGISSDMAQRLLTVVLKGPRFTSPTIICEYISVYRLLLKSPTFMMANKINEWMPQCFRALVDPNSAVQKQALSVLQDSSVRFLGRKEVAQCAISSLSETIKAPNDDELLLIDILCRQITTSLASTSGSSTALCIWKTVLLSIIQHGSGAEKIYNWVHFEKFLRLSKLGFNSANDEVKAATILSWKVPIYAYTMVPFYQYPASELETSILVVLHPFRLFETQNLSTQVKSALVSTFYSLLYMSLKAVSNLNLNSNQLSIVWEKIMWPVCQMLLKGEHVDLVVHLISHLLTVQLNGSPSKTQMKSPKILTDSDFTLEELPAFPPRWIRSNVMKVLSLLNGLKSGKTSERFIDVWVSFLGSLKHIIQRDIRIAQETIDAIGGICNFIRDCLKQDPIDYKLVSQLLKTTVDSIGMSIFMDCALEVDCDTLIVKRGRQPSVSIEPMLYLYKVVLKYGRNGAGLLKQITQIFKEKQYNSGKFLKILLMFARDLPKDESGCLAWNLVVDEVSIFLSGKTVGLVDYEDLLRWPLINPISNFEICGESWSNIVRLVSSKNEKSYDCSEFIDDILVAMGDADQVTECYLAKGLLYLLMAARPRENEQSASQKQNGSFSESLVMLSSEAEENAAGQIWTLLAYNSTPELNQGLFDLIHQFIENSDANGISLDIFLDKILDEVLRPILQSPPSSATDEYLDSVTRILGTSMIRLSEKEKSRSYLEAPTARSINMHSDLLVLALKSEHPPLVSGGIKIWNGFCKHKRGNVSFSSELVDVVCALNEGSDYDITVPKNFKRKVTPKSPAKSTATPIRKKTVSAVTDAESSVHPKSLKASTPVTRSRSKNLQSTPPQSLPVETIGLRRSSRKSSTPQYNKQPSTVKGEQDNSALKSQSSPKDSPNSRPEDVASMSRPDVMQASDDKSSHQRQSGTELLIRRENAERKENTPDSVSRAVGGFISSPKNGSDAEPESNPDVDMELESQADQSQLVEKPQHRTDESDDDDVNLSKTVIPDSQVEQIVAENTDPFVSDSEDKEPKLSGRLSGIDTLKFHTPSPRQSGNGENDDCNLIKGSGANTVPRAASKSRLISSQSDEIKGPKLWNSPKGQPRHVSNDVAKSSGLLGKYIGSFISSFRGQNEKGEDLSFQNPEAVVSVKELQQMTSNADYGEGFKRKRKRGNSIKGEKTKKKKSKKSPTPESDQETAFNVLISLLDKFDENNDYVKQLDPTKRQEFQDLLFNRFSGLYNSNR